MIKKDKQEGWTLLELTITIVVLAIGVISFIMALMSSLKLSAAGRDRDIAMNAGRQMIEIMKGETFTELFARYNADPDDDPGGSGTAPGPHFAVEGLTPVPGDTDGMVGEIIFPTSGGVLVEDISDPELGMPRDLNCDDVIDSDDRSGDYMLLPVKIKLQWARATGTWEVELRAYIIDE